MYSNLIRLSDYAEKKTLPSAFHEGKTYLCWYADIISTDKMSNRQNAEQTKCRQLFIFSIFFFLKFFYAEKQCGRQFWNAFEREPVETRVLNPTASEAS